MKSIIFIYLNFKRKPFKLTTVEKKGVLTHIFSTHDSTYIYTNVRNVCVCTWGGVLSRHSHTRTYTHTYVNRVCMYRGGSILFAFCLNSN